jgi:hypothetical protein
LYVKAVADTKDISQARSPTDNNVVFISNRVGDESDVRFTIKDFVWTTDRGGLTEDQMGTATLS